jgi:hypothetical protein
MTEEQNAVEAVAAPTPKILEPSVQTLRARFAKRYSRAVEKDDAFGQWTADFDLKRLQKNVIDPHEKRPFVDCVTPEEYLNTARIFAHAFRKINVACLDIEEGETIEKFVRRVCELWYSKPLGELMYFVSLNTFAFNTDLGFRRDEPATFEMPWYVAPDSDITVDVSTLPRIGMEPSQWEEEGFESYRDWYMALEERKAKQKAHEKLESKLNTQEEIDRRLNAVEPESTPKLLYRATLENL